ncbi:hypothetical protein Ancab_038902 [Ancistrocladus abbreviatus]
MSSRRPGAGRASEDELNKLMLKLQALLPAESRNRRHTTRVSASETMKEVCIYIKKLQIEVDELSERLSELLPSIDLNDADAEILRSLLQM